MAGGWPLLGAARYQTWGADTGNSRGTSVVAGGSANTKSASWVEIVSAANNTIDASGIIVLFDVATTATENLVDLAIGGAGSEVIIAANLVTFAANGNNSPGTIYHLPIAIPTGTRISAKSQSTTASTSIRTLILAYDIGLLPSSPLATIDTYGANTSDSGGVSIDPGGTAHTKPTTYTEITSSTTRPHKALMLGLGNQLNGTRAAGSWLLDIAIGASTSEQILIPDIGLGSSTAVDAMTPQTIGPLWVDVPAGTRLSARAQSGITDATDRLFDLVIYGIG